MKQQQYSMCEHCHGAGWWSEGGRHTGTCGQEAQYSSVAVAAGILRVCMIFL